MRQNELQTVSIIGLGLLGGSLGLAVNRTFPNVTRVGYSHRASTRRKALQNLSDRIPLDVLRSIIASVVQSEDLGTPLGEVLHEQATLLRQQRSVRAENLAAVASVRILLPCLLLVMAVIIMVVAPLALQAIRGGGLF